MCRSLGIPDGCQHLMPRLGFPPEGHSGPGTDLVQCTKWGEIQNEWADSPSLLRLGTEHREQDPAQRSWRCRSRRARALLTQLRSCSIPQVEVRTFSPSEPAYFCSLAFRNKSPSLPGWSHAINISMQVFRARTQCRSSPSSSEPGCFCSAFKEVSVLLQLQVRGKGDSGLQDKVRKVSSNFSISAGSRGLWKLNETASMFNLFIVGSKHSKTGVLFFVR